MRKPLLVASIAVLGGLVAGCVDAPGSTDSGELDPQLEAFDDGKYDGPILAVDAQQDYRIEVRKVETTEDYGEWTVQPDVYLSVNDSRSPSCPSADNCNFDLADVQGDLTDAGSERIWSGDELRDGVEFAVHEVHSDGGGGLIDEIKGLTRIRIGQTGSLRIKPFGKVKSIEFRVEF
jgi:hypothetical protein